MMNSMSLVAMSHIFATLWGNLGRYIQHKKTTRQYEGNHRRDPEASYEKRYDLKLAAKALGRWFEMPVHYVS